MIIGNGELVSSVITTKLFPIHPYRFLKQTTTKNTTETTGQDLKG
ncbi:hypothetical protein [Moorena sp. SIO1F2]|nr:hypothetical protein [Moorena sp. SIO1F2]